MIELLHVISKYRTSVSYLNIELLPICKAISHRLSKSSQLYICIWCVIICVYYNQIIFMKAIELTNCIIIIYYNRMLMSIIV